MVKFEGLWGTGSPTWENNKFQVSQLQFFFFSFWRLVGRFGHIWYWSHWAQLTFYRLAFPLQPVLPSPSSILSLCHCWDTELDLLKGVFARIYLHLSPIILKIISIKLQFLLHLFMMNLVCHVSAHMRHGAHVCVSEDSFQKLVLFFYHLGSSVRVQVGSLGGKCHNAITCRVISCAQ